MKKTIYFIVLGIFIGSSCSKEWLNVKVDQSQAVPTTIEDFQAMLDDYSNFNTSVLINGEIASDGHYYTEAVWNNLKGTKYQNMYTWTNDVVNYSSSEWNVPYSAILVCNVVLDDIDTYSEQYDSKLVANIKGQALFQRARILFELSQIYAPPMDLASKNAEFGIPLRLTTDVSVPTSRSTLAETYSQIISDLKVAAESLPDSQDYLTRPSRFSALALLSRVYLSIGEYDEALAAANAVLSKHSELLDYNNISKSATYIGLNSEVLSICFLNAISQLTTNYLITEELINSYSDNDLRKEVFFAQTGGGVRFKGTYGNAPTHIFIGLSIDEVYLNRAECLARKGNIADAMADINTLLSNRFKKIDGVSTYTDQVALSEEEALHIILSERRKQLLLRNVRWMDLRRLGSDPRFSTIINRNIGGGVYVLEPNSFRYTFPIPDEIIEKAGIQQNPGWVSP